jgi:hypothetical protein
MTLYDTTVELANQLSIYDKVRLMEHLSELLRQDMETEAYKRMPWHEFIERTAGSLADDPVQRWPQGEYEEREPLE